jgi:hypothetical protein
MDNPWLQIFVRNQGRYIPDATFDSILKSEKVKSTDSDDENKQVMYEVDTVELVITCNNSKCQTPIKRHFASTKYINFFDWLSKLKNDIITKQGDDSYIIRGRINMYPNLSSAIVNIFNTLQPSVGSGGSLRRRNRRPSRKYKKSKRVLRRKSRSTRRR